MLTAGCPITFTCLRIAGRYAREMQRHRTTTGHFFERRYRAILVDAESYLLELIRYIHLNPVRASLVQDPSAYRWSGHRAYLGLETAPWLTTDFALSLFASDVATARERYHHFVLAGVGVHPDNKLILGRSDDARILGTDAFLNKLAIRPTPRPTLSAQTLIERICHIHAVESVALRTPGRQRQAAKLRALILHHALRLRIATLSDMARHFNRSASTLSETLDLYRRIEPELFEHSIDLDT